MMKRSVVATLVMAGVVLALSVPAFAGGGGRCVDRPVTYETTNQVDLTKSCFGPTVARIAPGDTVTFLNRDPLPHTVTGANLVWGSTEHLGSGEAMSVRFDEPGIHPYVCILHVGMVGAVEVTDGNIGSQQSLLAAPLAASSNPLDPSNALHLTLGVWAVAMTAVVSLIVWSTRSRTLAR